MTRLGQKKFIIIIETRKDNARVERQDKNTLDKTKVMTTWKNLIRIDQTRNDYKHQDKSRQDEKNSMSRHDHTI